VFHVITQHNKQRRG
jgi:hypothetical protein